MLNSTLGKLPGACWMDSKPVTYGAARLTVTISIGVSLYPRHASNFTTLYKAADEMLYKVKSRGRSGSAVCGEDGELSSSARLQVDVLNVPSGLGWLLKDSG